MHKKADNMKNKIKKLEMVSRPSEVTNGYYLTYDEIDIGDKINEIIDKLNEKES